jgi:hypothetical protein
MNIPEGADFSEMPRYVGAGRIMSDPRINERYMTIRAFGWRLFVATGNYRAGKLRYWVKRDAF